MAAFSINNYQIRFAVNFWIHATQVVAEKRYQSNAYGMRRYDADARALLSPDNPDHPPAALFFRNKAGYIWYLPLQSGTPSEVTQYKRDVSGYSSRRAQWLKVRVNGNVYYAPSFNYTDTLW